VKSRLDLSEKNLKAIKRMTAALGPQLSGTTSDH
jgi:hypothetical protein